MIEIFIQTFVLYFIAIDPLGNTTLFLIVTQRLKIKDKIQLEKDDTYIKHFFTCDIIDNINQLQGNTILYI